MALGLFALWLLATIAWRPLLLPDEGRYASVAYEMLLGDGLVPTLNGLPFFHKPPLLYWLDMAAMKVLGVQVWAARVGPALGAFALGASLYVHLKHWHGTRVATAALTLLATMPFLFVGGQYVNHDMGVAGCITVAILAAVRGLDTAAPHHRGWLMQAWLFCGLGVLAKGLIGLVLPGLVVLPWLLAQGRWREVLKLLHPYGLLVFVAVVAPWMVNMQWRFPEFFDYFIIEQHFQRYSQATFNNQQAFWFYLAVVPLVTLPWSLWLWPALRQALRGVRGQTASQATVGQVTTVPGSLEVTRAQWGLYLWWVVVIVAFFSMPRSKLVGYVLPMVGPWAALLALTLAPRERLWPRVALGAAVVCVALVGVLAWKAPKSAEGVARVLGSQIQPGDRVVFVDEFFYDVPFYARLREPVFVLSRWDDPDIPRRDNWRKELWDAARFANPAQRQVLWPIAQAERLACSTGQIWWVTHSDPSQTLQGLPPLTLVHEARGVQLWKSAGRGADQATCSAPVKP